MGQRDWDERYLQLAAHISQWSKDHKRVGALLVRDNRIVGAGFNGLPSGIQDDFDRLSHKPTKLAMVVHAEENALLTAGERARGATLYVHGLPVCARCAASIIQAKVSVVISRAPANPSANWKELVGRLNRPPDDVDWDAMGELAIRMFIEARVEWHEAKLEEHMLEFMKELRKQPPEDRRSGKERRGDLRLAAE